MCAFAVDFCDYGDFGGGRMMQMLKEWLFGLVAVAMLLAMLNTLLPKRVFHAIGKVTGGLILMLVLMRPILGLRWEALSGKYHDYELQIEQQTEVYAQESQQQMEDIIEQRLNAYIWDTAVEMGLDCEAEVETQLRDGVPYPVSVTLYRDYHEELSDRIFRELGIAPEQQHWEDSR